MSLGKFMSPNFLLLIILPIKSRKMQVAVLQEKSRLFSNRQAQQNDYRGGYTGNSAWRNVVICQKANTSQ